MKCKDGVVQLIDQIIDTIDLIPNEDYNRPIDIFEDSTLGKHFRHIYDFFCCLTTQCQHQSVDYAMRRRDTSIEDNRDIAIERFSSIKYMIEDLEEDKTIKVYTDFMLEDGSRPEVQTTIGRELMYAYDHAVHHLAIVKIGLQSIDASFAINKNMGVAASTINHKYSTSHGH